MRLDGVGFLLRHPAISLAGFLRQVNSAFTVGDKTHSCQAVNEQLARVPLSKNSILARGIIKWISMMVIVPSLSDSHDGYQQILSRTLFRTIRAISKEMGNRVHTPCRIQDGNVAKVRQAERNQPVFVEEVHGEKSRYTKAEGQSHEGIILLLEHHDLVSIHVIHVHLLSGLDNIGRLLHHQPSKVTEPKSIVGIVRVQYSVTEAVVEAMIANPMPDGSLIRSTCQQHEKDADRKRSGKRAVGPHAVATHCNAHPVKGVHEYNREQES